MKRGERGRRQTSEKLFHRQEKRETRLCGTNSARQCCFTVEKNVKQARASLFGETSANARFRARPRGAGAARRPRCACRHRPRSRRYSCTKRRSAAGIGRSATARPSLDHQVRHPIGLLAQRVLAAAAIAGCVDDHAQAARAAQHDPLRQVLHRLDDDAVGADERLGAGALDASRATPRRSPTVTTLRVDAERLHQRLEQLAELLLGRQLARRRRSPPPARSLLARARREGGGCDGRFVIASVGGCDGRFLIASTAPAGRAATVARDRDRHVGPPVACAA